MDKSQRGSGSRRGPSGSQGLLRRLLDFLEQGLAGPRLIPAPIPVGWDGRPELRRPDPLELRIHRVFGRRKEEERDRADQEASGADASEPSDVTDQGSAEESPAYPGSAEDVEPTAPSGDEELAAASEETAAVDEPWSSSAANDPFRFHPSSESSELPAWTPSPVSGAGFPSFEPVTSDAESEPSPWSGGLGGDPAGPGTSEATEAPAGGGTWPQEAVDPGTQLWSTADREEAAGTPFAPSASGDAADVAAEPFPLVSDEGPDQYAATPAEEIEEEPAALEMEAATSESEPELSEIQPFEPDQLPEVVAVSETAWSVSSGEAEETPGYQALGESPREEIGATQIEAARAFPLPDGELMFRNLSVGFTDPARLLRHLAGEGHTGVMHVASADGRNTYIVLVEGYVVAVASDSQGRLSTSTRVSFPTFPNSRDIISVITYPQEIARGLGLLLHAPVHFAGLGAMFVDLDGLRSYLSKRSASGGLVVQSSSGIGVALFDEGRLVGAYSGSAAPESDLAPLRELIKDLDSEIDVRFGGPQSLEPIPLETLLAGYPL
ncbi:MAG: hypothetical protein ACYCYK_10265 [Candidatus Dormibacteria bacterium]